VSADSTAPKQQKVVGKPFAKGTSGNPAGRPQGSRNKLAESFVRDVLADWEASGLVTLQKLRDEKPDVYVKVVADLLPKIEEKTENLNVNHSGTIEHRSVSEIGERVTELLGRRPETDSPASLPH
jgi:hypothetical protein